MTGDAPAWHRDKRTSASQRADLRDAVETAAASGVRVTRHGANAPAAMMKVEMAFVAEAVPTATINRLTADLREALAPDQLALLAAGLGELTGERG